MATRYADHVRKSLNPTERNGKKAKEGAFFKKIFFLPFLFVCRKQARNLKTDDDGSVGHIERREWKSNSVENSGATKDATDHTVDNCKLCKSIGKFENISFVKGSGPKYRKMLPIAKGMIIRLKIK